MLTLPLVTLAVVYVQFFFLPNQGSIRELRDEATAKETFVLAGGNLASAVVATRAKLARLNEYTSAWEKESPKRSELAALFGKISSLAVSRQVSIASFDPQPVKRHDGICAFPLDISFSGTFSQTFAFLRDLEELPQSIWITRVNIEKIAEPRKDVECELSLDIFGDNLDNSGQDDRSG